VIVESFSAGPLGCNCTIVVDESTKEAVVVDPGGDLAVIRARLEKHGARAKAILHTHTHFDHVGATAPLQRETGAPARIHEGDQFLYSILAVQASLFGTAPPESAELDTWLKDGEVVALGGLDVHVLHTPGHTPGSCCFEVRSRGAGDENVVLLAGDTLFQRSIGRTDLWGGDHDAIVKSIRGKLFALPEPTRVICGHGPDTTIGVEKRVNPFVGSPR
jgi:glyoxylase-like metal-dependent hydrolase (beta-lactamase superfamily II)